jgi:hypothetical protein
MVVANGPIGLKVTLVDLAGQRHGVDFGQLVTTAPAGDPESAAHAVREHLQHLDLVTLAVQSGSVAELAPEHAAPRLLILLDFPTGLDESTLHGIRTLATEGPQYGVQVLATGSHRPGLGIPLLDVLYAGFLKLPSEPGGDLVDAYGGVNWVFHPDLGPADPSLLRRALSRLSSS